MSNPLSSYTRDFINLYCILPRLWVTGKSLQSSILLYLPLKQKWHLSLLREWSSMQTKETTIWKVKQKPILWQWIGTKYEWVKREASHSSVHLAVAEKGGLFCMDLLCCQLLWAGTASRAGEDRGLITPIQLLWKPFSARIRQANSIAETSGIL